MADGIDGLLRCCGVHSHAGRALPAAPIHRKSPWPACWVLPGWYPISVSKGVAQSFLLPSLLWNYLLGTTATGGNPKVWMPVAQCWWHQQWQAALAAVALPSCSFEVVQRNTGKGSTWSLLCALDKHPDRSASRQATPSNMVSRCTSGSVSPMFDISHGPRQPLGAHLSRLPTQAFALSEQHDKRSTREQCSHRLPCIGGTLKGKRTWDLCLMQSETIQVMKRFATKP